MKASLQVEQQQQQTVGGGSSIIVAVLQQENATLQAKLQKHEYRIQHLVAGMMEALLAAKH